MSTGKLLGRREALRLAAAGAVGAVLRPRRLLAASRPPLEFLVFVDGKRSGTYGVEFVPRADGFTALSAMSIRVEVAFITAYRYQQDGQEDWRNGRLVAFEYLTNDNGKTALVSARRDGDSFVVKGPRGQASAPGDAMSSGFWNEGIVKANRLIDPQTAALVPLKVQALGSKSAHVASAPIQGSEFALDTFLRGTIWFDHHHHLLASSFTQDGHKVELRRA